MKSYDKNYELDGRTIVLRADLTDCGLQVLIAGGDLSHIGAVSIADPAGKIETITFPGHKETIVAEKYARKLYEVMKVPIVVSAGIHYDKIIKEGILAVLEMTDTILEELIRWAE